MGTSGITGKKNAPPTKVLFSSLAILGPRASHLSKNVISCSCLKALGGRPLKVMVAEPKTRKGPRQNRT